MSTRKSLRTRGGVHCFNLVRFAINDRTHVVQTSFEYSSSYWCEIGLMSDHTTLTRQADAPCCSTKSRR
jgi:hypothetical protein